MKLSGLFSKLRKTNKNEYVQFQFCITLSVMLITSYLFMFGSELVQKTLPNGGDSRKIADMIFAIAVLGCMMFSIYATSLFLRYKSREIGVFSALGAQKKTLANNLFAETGKVMAMSFGIGIVLGTALAGILGKLFELIARMGNDNRFTFSLFGLAGGIGYCVVLLLCVAVMCARFMKKTNIIDIINEQRKQEPLKKTVTRRYLLAGLLMILTGLLIAFAFPNIAIRYFNIWPGAWTNLFYALVAVGLYRILIYSIVANEKGKRPQKYYRKMIAQGMLKFQGASIVRNMFVTVLLIMGGLFGIFYQTLQAGTNYDFYEDDISLRYPITSDELTKDEILSLAETYDTALENYREAEMILVLGDGIDRSNLGEDGQQEEYFEKLYYYECISASQYSKLTGKDAAVDVGHYRQIVSSSMKENIYNKFGDTSRLYFADGKDYLPVQYDGNDIYHSLVRSMGFDNDARFILNDQDYEALRENLDSARIIRQILFDVAESGRPYEFSEKLYEMFCSRATPDMDYIAAYNLYPAQIYGEEYSYDMPAVYDGTRPALATDWVYSPVIVPILEENQLMSRAVFLLLFLYISVICLAAQSVILYTRSQNVALGSRQIFADLEKLGANRKFKYRLLKVQIRKAFLLPTALGCTLIYLYQFMILWQNDGALELTEIAKAGSMFIAILIVCFFQFILYQISMKKAAGMLKCI